MTTMRKTNQKTATGSNPKLTAMTFTNQLPSTYQKKKTGAKTATVTPGLNGGTATCPSRTSMTRDRSMVWEGNLTPQSERLVGSVFGMALRGPSCGGFSGL